MNRFPRYELALCSNLTGTKQEIQKDYVYNAVFIERKRSRRELPVFVLAKVNQILGVDLDA